MTDKKDDEKEELPALKEVAPRSGADETLLAEPGKTQSGPKLKPIED
jgi:hypothetical protein